MFKLRKNRKIMSFILAIVMVSLAFSTSAIAQTNIYDDQFLTDLTEKIADKLGISAECLEIDTISWRELTIAESESMSNTSVTRSPTWGWFNCCSNRAVSGFYGTTYEDFSDSTSSVCFNRYTVDVGICLNCRGVAYMGYVSGPYPMSHVGNPCINRGRCAG